MKRTALRSLCEGAIMVAAALVLSYIEIPIGVAFGGFGGSIHFVMVPLIVYAAKWGTWQGIIAGFAFGTLKFFLAGGAAVSWQSMLLDYSLAYAAVGFAGLLRGTKAALPVGAVVGCIARFAVHFISGVTIYAQYMPEVFLGLSMPNATIYSILYNGTYMLPNTVLAIVICVIIMHPLRRFMTADTLKSAKKA